MSGYYEPASELDKKTRALSHGLNSLMEELEAIDYYNQRASTCSDPELRSIMEHNRDEEIEHAVMAIEWLRRNMDKWDDNLREFLFTTAPITQIEDAGAGAEKVDAADGSLGLGKL